MSELNVQQLKKKIEVLEYWNSRLLSLSEIHLTSFDKWCLANHISEKEKDFITNLTGLYIMFFYPDQNHPEIKKVMDGFKSILGIHSVELNYEDFKFHLNNYERLSGALCKWNPDDLLVALYESGRCQELKESFIG
ncbi:hypothetical protein YDYSY3_38180 [Paenibacillus chitinolyticus]|uniref:hypothetical protein n=1 Tax=Paenibacillus chitinolyticus TaxID=79263 RepID=UPI0026E4A427|nr:hypothetical protein [Paenibacillus chitinolyticus]GKS12818.1 hypothetical protein YDYSY3_38180 [Paenibacillus chitinolyticus]